MLPSGTTRVALIVPSYNEAAGLKQNVEHLLAFFRQQPTIVLELVIADGSDRDDTPEIADALAAAHPEVSVRHFPRGAGKGEKIRATALELTSADVQAFVDADLPITAEELLRVIRAVDDANIAVASKYVAGGSSSRPWFRVILSRAGNRALSSALRVPVRDFIAGAKAWDQSVVERVWPDVQNRAFLFDAEVLCLAHRRGLSILEVPVRYVDHRVLTSKVRVARLAAEFAWTTWRLLGRR